MSPRLVTARPRSPRRGVGFRSKLPVALATLGSLAIPLGALPQAVHAQALAYRADAERNPLPPPLLINGNSTPSFGDLDGDGDLDIVAGQSAPFLTYLENTGTAQAPSFTPREGDANPFEDIAIDSDLPILADVDSDGDLDLVLGRFGGTFGYFENTGTAQAPTFTARTGSDDPFGGITLNGYLVSPSFGDLDGDGDLDLVAGSQGGGAYYLENTGTAQDPSFTERTGAASPLTGFTLGYRAVPSLGDIDGDGDLDITLGNYSGLYYLENTGSAQAAAFTLRLDEASPFDEFSAVPTAYPDLIDLDGDGDLDLVAGDRDGALNYFENTGSAQPTEFIERLGEDSPLSVFSGTDIGNSSNPEAVDLDGDGDLDLVVGRSSDALRYFENVGTATMPDLRLRTGSADPFDGLALVHYITPALADLDGDGDLDLAVGTGEGGLRYFENTGSAAMPMFTARTEAANPLGIVPKDDEVYLQNSTSPTFGDLDGDGDLDVVVGAYDGTLSYFENTGTAAAPAFAARAGADSPVAGIDDSTLRDPVLVDLDGDGDLDLVVGSKTETVSYFENTGTAQSPIFTERDDAANPFDGAQVRNNNDPSFGDFDGDGALEAIVGNGFGQFDFLETDFVSIPLSTSAAVPADAPLRLEVYPNPAASASGFTFEAEAREAGPLLVEVYDVLGRRVESLVEAVVTPGEVVSVRVSGLTSGVYFVRAMQGSHTATQRVSVVR